MNFCFNGLKSGPVCLGDPVGRLHGETLTMGHIGLGMLGVILLACMIYVFRDPA